MHVIICKFEFVFEFIEITSVTKYNDIQEVSSHLNTLRPHALRRVPVEFGQNLAMHCKWKPKI